jgi:UDP-N-acetylmuramate--alanine ligase
LEIYPAREKPIVGVTSTWLLEKLKIKNKRVLTKSQVLEEIKINRPEVLLTMGAGDIDALVEPIEKILKPENSN